MMATKLNNQTMETIPLSDLMNKLSLKVRDGTRSTVPEQQAKVGVIYDSDMCNHFCREDRTHGASPSVMSVCSR